MAKAEKPETSKKQLVTDYFAANPDATTAAVVDALGKQGIVISPRSVHTIKWSLKKGKWPAAKKAAKNPAEKMEAMPQRAAAEPAADTAKVNKTQAVKDFLAEHRKAGPTEIVAALQAQGIDVSTNYVSNIKSQMGFKKKRRKQETAAPEAATAAAPAAGDEISLAALVEAKKLIEKLGGVDVAKRAIMALAQLGK